MRGQYIIGFMLLVVLGGLYWTEPDITTPFWVTATVQDREFCIHKLNNLSDWVGFQAHFFPEGHEARTLVMTGTDLCSPDFLKLLPKVAYDDVVSVGFYQARCETPDGRDYSVYIDQEDRR